MGDPLVRLVDVHKSFGRQRVLMGVNLDIRRGACTVILGPSGVGKSVLIKLIVRLMRPDRGEIYFDGRRIDNLREKELVAVRNKVGFLFQMSALFDSMSVAQNICFPLVQHTDLSEAQRGERCAAVLRMVGLDGVQAKMPAELSGGQRKRVALARAIVLEPKLILYDEPTTGLDPIRSDVINELILALHRHLHNTSIVVTHDIASAFKVADRLVMLNEGRIMADGDPRSFRQSSNEMVQRFIHGMADEEDLNRIREGLSEGSAAGSLDEKEKVHEAGGPGLDPDRGPSRSQS
jgi:phospholipid/cholesterol/gamma-HCH transport system ATP-binding protein